MEHFRLKGELVSHLKERCPNLKLLEVSMEGIHFGYLLKLLQDSCLHLEELLVYGLELNKVPEVAAFANIKKLTCLEASRFFVHEELDMFIACLQYFNLQHININGFVHSRNGDGGGSSSSLSATFPLSISSESSTTAAHWSRFLGRRS